MTVELLVVLIVLLAGCVVSWHPAVVAAADRYPWWLVALVPSAVLAVAGVLAAVSAAGQSGGLADAVAVACVGIAVTGGRGVTDAVLHGAGGAGIPDIEHPTGVVEQEGDHRPHPHPRPVLRGGVWIGALERAAVAGCLLAGVAEGVAVVLAIKGLGRYPELRASGAAERFIIGTFASLLWAGAAAGVALLIR
jgi:hypothetical protein